MAISTRINGVFRDNESESARINGVWRDTYHWVKINGVWREVSGGSNITESDIVGFRLVYVLNKHKLHPDYPHLKYNPKIPYIADLAGENVGVMDMTFKSMVFEFNRDEYKEEGIIMFEGTLYAVLKNGNVVNISGIDNDSSLVKNVRLYNKTKGLDITMRGYSMYELHGRFIDGWNNFFTNKKFMMMNNLPGGPDDRHVNLIHLEHFLPVEEREETYSPIASIGIARDMSSPDNNMIGSKGTLDHTLQEIYVNEVQKPFVIEIYQ